MVSISSPIPHLFLLLLLTLLSPVAAASGRDATSRIPGREGLEIGIGIGIGIGRPSYEPPPEEGPDCPPPPPPPKPICPPPPPPPPPPSPPPLFPGLYQIVQTIQKLKKTITCDPKNVTNTWTNRPEDICAEPNVFYKGFYCEVPPGRTQLTVAAIDFNGFGLCSSSVGKFLPNFTDLALFHANSNNFSGTIPSSIAKLPFLYEFDISNNKFSGTFPSAVLGIKKIRFLDLRYNAFSGSVPMTAFLIFPIIDVLFINNNNLMQALPDSLGSTKAKYITLANNQFTGLIPRTIGNAGDTLKEILFLNNKLCGCLPYEIGSLRLATVFDVSQNLLVGPIPYSFACLTKIEQLVLSENRLRGAIPEVLCSGNLRNLLNLNLSYNYFTELGPKCLKLAEKKVLDVRKNCIPGLPDQRPVTECAKFLCQPTYCPNPSTYRIVTCTLLHSVEESKSLPSSTSSSSSSSSRGESAAYQALHRNP